MVCPFFRQNEDYCDVGCGYISPHDVKMIVAFCQCRFGECSKFQELASRFPAVAIRGERPPLPPVELPAAAAVAAHPGPLLRNERPVHVPFRKKWPLAYQLRYVTAHYHETYQSPEEENMSAEKIKNRGWTVALAGTGINLALGILYTWSIFKGAIADSIKAGGPGAFNWDPASLNDPYAVACLVFAAAMILAGKLQDKFGPRITCMIGGLLVGSGFIWISQTNSYLAWVLGFGVLAGGGMGFGYSAATPPALKWFPPAKTGLIAGIVVSGFGLASVYIAPLATYLVTVHGLQQAMMVFGIAFAVVVCSLALLISNPPPGYIAEVSVKANAKKAPAKPVVDVPPSKIFADARFYTLWVCYFIGAGAGLMVIGSAKGLASASMGQMAFLVVAIMAVGNAAGRLVAGVVSDKVGRANTLTFMLVFQAALMFLAIPGLAGTGNPLLVGLLVTFMVFNYGTNLALFPSFAKDYWGMKNFGMNYGILFSAWGVGGLVLVRFAEMLKVKTGSVTTTFAVAGVMLLVGAMMSLSLRTRKVAVPAEAPVAIGVEDEDLVFQEAGTK
jgi:nitrate/nitrite transporter NarK